MGQISISHDLEYLAIFSLVLIFPKLLLRYKIPSGITALVIGIIVGFFDPKVSTDQLFRFLSQIGITSLFVFAGLEVEFDELKRDRKYLGRYLIKSIFFISILAIAISKIFELSYQWSFLMSLGIFTPSAGFIINSLHSFNISADREYWIKSKAISKEIISIILLFFALQVNEPRAMGVSLAFFAVLYLLLPLIFKFFFRFISPYAPNTEVPFLVALSLISGVISKELGAYYLVGAFMVGLIGSRFKSEIFKDKEESIFMSLSSFFNVFLPFYFFYSGLKINVLEIELNAFLMGLAFVVIFIPLRLFVIYLSVNTLDGENKIGKRKISLSLMPTLIFGLVIAGILKDKNAISDTLFYALIIYTLLSSLVPAFMVPKSYDVTQKAQH